MLENILWLQSWEVVQCIFLTVLKFGIVRNKLDRNDDKRVYLNHFTSDDFDIQHQRFQCDLQMCVFWW